MRHAAGLRPIQDRAGGHSEVAGQLAGGDETLAGHRPPPATHASISSSDAVPKSGSSPSPLIEAGDEWDEPPGRTRDEAGRSGTNGLTKPTFRDEPGPRCSRTNRPSTSLSKATRIH